MYYGIALLIIAEGPPIAVEGAAGDKDWRTANSFLQHEVSRELRIRGLDEGDVAQVVMTIRWVG